MHSTEVFRSRKIADESHIAFAQSLSFRKSSHQLFSASYDRTVKIFDLSPDVMGYVETLFGHQDTITSIDALRAETAVTSGSRDRTLRFWKVVEENQLVFRGGGRSALRDVLEGVPADDAADQEEERRREKGKGKNEWLEGSMECVAMVDDSTFVSGGDSGCVSLAVFSHTVSGWKLTLSPCVRVYSAIRLWSTHKKKAVYTHGLAHGLHSTPSTHSPSGHISTPRWILSLAALRYSNVFASGSWDGYVRLWKIEDKARSFTPLAKIEAAGFVNSLMMVSPKEGWGGDVEWANERRKEKAKDDKDDGEDDEMEDEADDEPGSPPPPSPAPAPAAPPTQYLGPQRHCLIVAGLGQEPRLGRWMRIAGEGTGSRNQVLVAAIPYKEDLSLSNTKRTSGPRDRRPPP